MKKIKPKIETTPAQKLAAKIERKILRQRLHKKLLAMPASLFETL